MSEAELLQWLRRVKSELDRDDVRLVFADWLDEQGDRRGEWVRVQCRRSSLPPDHPDQTALAAREAELARDPLRGWLEPWLPYFSDRRLFPASAEAWETELYPPLPLDAAWPRGLFHLNCPGSALLRTPLSRLAAGPEFEWVETLCVALATDETRAVLRQNGTLARPARLALSCLAGDFDEECFAALVGSVPPTNLTCLDFEQCGLGDEAVAELVGSPVMGSVEVVNLTLCSPGNLTAQAFSNTPQAGRLRVLLLTGHDMTDVGAAALASAPALARLTYLNLSAMGAGFSAAGARAIAASRHFAGLTALALQNNTIGRDGLAALAHSPELRSLSALQVAYNGTGEGTGELLAASSQPGRWSWLGLSGNGISDVDVVALARAPLSNLKVLDLSDNEVTDAGAVALADSPSLSSLIGVNLISNHVGERGRVALRSRFGDGCRL